jgi:hypothetical protein
VHAQHPRDEGGQQGDPRQPAGLGGEHNQAAVNPLEPAPHLQHTAVQVDVLPAEAEDLAPPHAQQGEHDEQCVEAVTAHGPEQRAHLLDVQRRAPAGPAEEPEPASRRCAGICSSRTATTAPPSRHTSPTNPTRSKSSATPPPSPTSSHVVLVDNSDQQNVELTSAWTTVDTADGMFGFATPPARPAPGKTPPEWTLHIPADGTYEMFAR